MTPSYGLSIRQLRAARTLAYQVSRTAPSSGKGGDRLQSSAEPPGVMHDAILVRRRGLSVTLER